MHAQQKTDEILISLGNIQLKNTSIGCHINKSTNLELCIYLSIRIQFRAST